MKAAGTSVDLVDRFDALYPIVDTLSYLAQAVFKIIARTPVRIEHVKLAVMSDPVRFPARGRILLFDILPLLIVHHQNQIGRIAQPGLQLLGPVRTNIDIGFLH